MADTVVLLKIENLLSRFDSISKMKCLIASCNDKRLKMGKKEIFRITDIGWKDRILYVYKNHYNWDEFVDYLYMLIFENVQKGNLKDRIVSCGINLLAFQEINKLRQDIRHDKAHDDNFEKDKKRVGEIYKKYTGKFTLDDMSDSEINSLSDKVTENLICFLSDIYQKCGEI